MSETQIPPGWALVDVNDLAAASSDITDGPFGSNLKSDHYTESGPRVVRLQNIGDGFFVNESAHIAPDHFEQLRKHEVVAGDVVVAMLGEHLPRACLVPEYVGPAIVKADCVRLRPDARIAEPGFVSAGLNSSVVRQQAKDLSHGVGRPRLGLTLFRTLKFPLAPAREQSRIVDAVDSFLSRLDAAVATLEAAQAKLKAYRASVLKAAVGGRLVPTEAVLARAEKRDYEPASELLKRILAERRRRWEEAELAKLKAAGKPPKDDKWKAKYEEPKPPDTKGLPELPDGWCWASAAQISEFITKGTTPPGALMTQGLGDVPYIKVYNLTFDGTLDFATEPTFVPKSVHEQELARSLCRPGDVLMNIVGPPLGKVSIVPATFVEWNINQAIARYRPVVLPARYLAYVLLGNQTQRWALKRAKATAGQLNLTLEIARDLPIPLAPLCEQERIVDSIEHYLSAATATLNTISTDVTRCTRLRQSILKWAFEGKLVDQDANDEPAEKLLARIRAERANTPAPKKARRARGTS